MQILKSTFLCVSLILFSYTAQAAKVGGVDLPAQIESSGPLLQLNGAGIRKKFFISV